MHSLENQSKINSKTCKTYKICVVVFDDAVFNHPHKTTFHQTK